MLLVFALFGAASQAGPRDGFLAIQNQVEAIQPALVKTVVNLRMAGATGSGVIISADGLVLTAGHVISGRRSSRCTVTLPDGRNLPATYLGSDRESDLGLVKINEAQDLPVAPLGDSSTLRRGQWLLAMGHPLGQMKDRPPVLRIGRIISLMRSRDESEPVRVSTDAPLISGDSGGPLFDLNGRVVGINSMITSAGRRMASIHVPVNLAKAAVEAAKKGEETRTWSGPSAAYRDALTEAGAALRDAGHADAIRHAREAVRLDPASAAAPILMARAYAKMGKPDLAAAALVDAADRGFNDPEFIRSDPDFSTVTRLASVTRLLDRLDNLNTIPGQRKGDRLLLSAAGSAAASLARGVVRIRTDEKDVALGTLMSADGDILTKASELPEGILTVILSDGRSLIAERVGTETGWDVALLRVKASGLQTAIKSDSAPPGHWTFTPDSAGGLAAIGIVGVAEMPVRGKGIAPRPTSRAYMGVSLAPVDRETLDELKIKQGVRMFVQPDLPADRAGIRTGDIVVEVEGKPVDDPDTFMDLMVNKKPGDTVTVRLARGEERIEATINLTTRPADLPGRGGLPEMLSGEVSRVSGPFPRVIHHDAILRPAQMGGPVLDTEGRLLGLNIARADRTSTYAIPARDLQEIYARLKASK